jgi:YebC/PmpR family DNA-binding regulatory protein
MSGHNKWSKIKHKKAATDAKKSKVFSKYSKLITVAAKKANGDANSPEVRTIVEKARKENMPKDNIDKAIKKATEVGGGDLSPVVYEAYGPGGSAMIISGLTDNNNRTAAEVRHALSKHNIELAATGSASWAFDKNEDGYTPTTTVDLSDEDSEKLEKIIDSLDEVDDVDDVYTNVT